MDFERIIKDVERLGINLYDFALYTPDNGIQAHHFQPCGNCHNSYSVAKAFITAALGMLCDEGKIRMSDPLGQYFDFPENADPRFSSATIEHAATHRLGFDEGFLDIDCEDASLYPTKDYLSIVLSHPLAHDPGTHEQYSDAAFYLLSRLISQVTGERADVFLNRRLLQPLSFREAAWSRCPQDYPIGATGLYIGAADMVKLGALYLRDGVWQGERLLSSDWTKIAIEKEYELHPVFPDAPSCDLIGKWGMYGQLLAFSRKKNFAIAFHAHALHEDMQPLIEYLSVL